MYNNSILVNDSFFFTKEDSNMKNKSYISRMRNKLIKRFVFSSMAVIIGGTALGFGLGFAAPCAKNLLSSESLPADSINGLSAAEIKNTNLASSKNSNMIENIQLSVVSITSSDFLTNVFERKQEINSGSGIIFYKTANNIYIATNYHVISGASSVGVSVENSEPVSATLIGKNQNADIAVISISREDLKNVGINDVSVAYFGDSDTLNIGDTVIAIGNALGEGNTATSGIVSAVQKDIPINGFELSVIQTDAAINPGNDGGALINTRGEIIGINTAKFAYYTVEGVGYSISSNIAKPIIEEIMNKTQSPSLGIQITSVTEETEDGLPQTGVLVEKVYSGTTASRAGIREADIITSFNSVPIFTPAQLTAAVQKCNVGDRVDIKIIRNGRVMNITAVMLPNTDTSF